MGDILGMGKILDVKSGNIPIDCKKNGVFLVNGWACDKTDCKAYGTWYCIFSW